MSESETTKADYDVARDEMQAWWEQSGLAAEVSAPRGVVSDGRAMIQFTVSFASLSHVSPTRVEYRLGVGHVDWKKAQRAPVLNGVGWSNGEQFVNTMVHGHTPKDQVTLAGIAAKISKAQKVQPSPVEVLANAARDGEALYQPFEEWAGDLGYDLDSRKAESVWRACCDNGRKVIALVGKDAAEKLAEWAGRL